MTKRIELGGAAARAVAFLARCRTPDGGAQEPLDAVGRDPRVALTRLENVFDVWHTVNLLATFDAAGRGIDDSTAYLRRRLLPEGGFSYGSSTTGLCVETTALAALVVPGLRSDLRAVLRRYALSAGRWTTFIHHDPSGFDWYLAGPSVTAWALTALGPDDPLTPAGRQFLIDTRAPSGAWRAHEFAYATPFYPSHLGIRWVPEPGLTLDYARATVGASGAWGYGDPPSGEPGVVPTSLALLTLLAGDPTLETTRDLALGAARWLVKAQRADGSFPVDPPPPAVWYLGPVYGATLAARALIALANTGVPTPEYCDE